MHVDDSAGIPPQPRDMWRTPFAQNILPFLSSLVLHAGLIALGLLTVKAVQIVVGPGDIEQTTSGVMEILPRGLGAPVSTDALRGPGDDPFVRTMQDENADVPADATGWSKTTGVDLNSFIAGAGEGESAAEAMIGIGPGAGSGKGDRGIGGGDGDGGPAAPFGPPGKGGTPDGIFRPDPRHRPARSVVYLCDASGSMIEHFDPLRAEIHKSVHALKPVQAFNVIFFQDATAASASPGGLLMAKPENKRKAEQFLAQVPASGATDPIPGLELAFRQKPDLVWLLTDGDFADNAGVVQYIRRHNAGARVQINTIAFVNRGEDYEKVLQTIASENRGEFRYVAEDELGR